MGLDVDAPRPAAILDEGRFRPQALGSLAETLTTEPPSGGAREVPVEALLEEDLAEALARFRAGLGEVDGRVAAASWTNYAATVLVPGLVAAWTVADVGVDASPSNLCVHLDEGVPRRWRIQDSERVAEGDRERDRTIATLVDTLNPLFADVEERTGLAERVGWAHVGNVVAYLFDRLAELGAIAPDDPDRARLLAAEALPGTGSNPLQGTVERGSLGPGVDLDSYQVRTVCCLKRQLPGRAPCASCPHIDADRRTELVAERRGSG
jgi:siderophore-iron reductase FhuF